MSATCAHTSWIKNVVKFSAEILLTDWFFKKHALFLNHMLCVFLYPSHKSSSIGQTFSSVSRLWHVCRQQERWVSDARSSSLSASTRRHQQHGGARHLAGRPWMAQGPAQRGETSSLNFCLFGFLAVEIYKEGSSGVALFKVTKYGHAFYLKCSKKIIIIILTTEYEGTAVLMLFQRCVVLQRYWLKLAC